MNTKEKKEGGVNPQVQKIMDEWADVIQEAKQPFARRLRELAEDGGVSAEHIMNAVICMGVVTAQMVSLIPTDKLQDGTMEALATGIRLQVMEERLRKLKAGEGRPS